GAAPQQLVATSPSPPVAASPPPARSGLSPGPATGRAPAPVVSAVPPPPAANAKPNAAPNSDNKKSADDPGTKDPKGAECQPKQNNTDLDLARKQMDACRGSPGALDSAACKQATAAAKAAGLVDDKDTPDAPCKSAQGGGPVSPACKALRDQA